MTATIGLLVGRERSFPDALIAEVTRRKAGVVCRYAKIDATRHDRPLPYEVLLDRISHDVTCYQPVLKVAALHGTRVVNNPFWRIADDKFFDAALAAKLGIAVPKTVVLPSKSWGEDVTEQSLTNLVYPIDWQGIVGELGMPLYIKPHWGGGWKNVKRVTSLQELWAAYDQTGTLTMMVQQEIRWTQYVRCIVLGKNEVLPALWDPRLPHHERYIRAAKTMPALDPALEARLVRDSIKLCSALGYDMNTVEWAIADGVPFAIDFMNSAPDLDVSSLGESHFRWAVSKMADLLIKLALEPKQVEPRWDRALGG